MAFTTVIKHVGYFRMQEPAAIRAAGKRFWPRLRSIRHIYRNAGPALELVHLIAWMRIGDTGMIPKYEYVEHDPWHKN